MRLIQARCWVAVLFLMPLFLFSPAAQPGKAADTGSITIPIPPLFVPALQADNTPRFMTMAAVKNDFRKYNPDLNTFIYNPHLNEVAIIVPDNTWLKHLVETYQAMIRQLTMKPEADTWDCENYSSLLNALATLKLWQQGYTRTRAAVGWLRVNGQKSWAGIPAGMHALMYTVTTEGIYIVEPQNGSYIRLAEYPNRQFIEEVYLF